MEMKRRMISFFLLFQVMEHRWNEIDMGKPKFSGKNLSQCPFFHPKFHSDPESNPVLCGGRPATNCLSHGTDKRSFTFTFIRMLVPDCHTELQNVGT
jgi:hypothetical protein